MLPHLSARCLQQQIARRRIYLQTPYALEAEHDLPWVCSRRDLEIILKTLLLSVIEQVDAGIDLRVPDPLILRHIPVPLLRVIADEVVRPRVHLPLACDARRAVRPLQSHPHDAHR